MTRQFPLNPDMRHLRAQAKRLLAGCRSGDPLAISTIRTHHPQFSALQVDVIARTVRLCDAQTVVAHQYGASDWSQLNTSVNLACRNVQDCSLAMRDPRLDDPGFRAQLAARKGLPPVGTYRVSACGVQYTVVDFLPAVSPQSYARVRSGRTVQHIEDLLPLIAFSDMSLRLRELLLETDCATTKQIVFLDTMPEMHPGTAAPGLNQVCAIADENALFFHFDAAQAHETIIAHELGHVWIEYVEGCEDYRQMREPDDFARSSQFQHVQSFVLDLRVNQFLADRGFDMSIIADHEAESTCNLAEQCARGNSPRNRRVIASVTNAIAAALIELPKFHSRSTHALMDAFEMIRIAMPAAFEAALGFVATVERHCLDTKWPHVVCSYKSPRCTVQQKYELNLRGHLAMQFAE